MRNSLHWTRPRNLNQLQTHGSFCVISPPPLSAIDARFIFHSRAWRCLSVVSALTSDGGVIVSEKSERGIGKRGRRREKKKKNPGCQTQTSAETLCATALAAVTNSQNTSLFAVSCVNYCPHISLFTSRLALSIRIRKQGGGGTARHGTGLFFLFFHCYHDYLFIYLLQRKEITAWIKSVAACPVHSHHCLAGERRMTIPLLW